MPIIKKYCSICGRKKHDMIGKRCRCHGRMWVTKKQYSKIMKAVKTSKRGVSC